MTEEDYQLEQYQYQKYMEEKHHYEQGQALQECLIISEMCGVSENDAKDCNWTGRMRCQGCTFSRCDKTVDMFGEEG